MKKAILTVCFGTSHEDAWESCIRPAVEEIRRLFPDCEHRMAITSRMILRKLRERGEALQNEQEALEALKAEGYTDIRVITLHMIPGFEYEKLCGSLQGIPVSQPLLSTEEGFRAVVSLLKRIAAETGRTPVAMGHGTEHEANEIYARLNQAVAPQAYVACVEGENSLESILDELEAVPGKRVAILPLMLVAGDHAKNDLNGDEPDSWRSILTGRGFDVTAVLRGLGSYPEIRSAFAKLAGQI